MLTAANSLRSSKDRLSVELEPQRSAATDQSSRPEPESGTEPETAGESAAEEEDEETATGESAEQEDDAEQQQQEEEEEESGD